MPHQVSVEASEEALQMPVKSPKVADSGRQGAMKGSELMTIINNF